jgi:putative ABC transport system ATP-binding protein
MSPKDAKIKAEACLRRVGITPEQMKRFPSNLSGGEQQRVAIARSLASGARTILADEPTGNLDAENTGNIMDILESLSRDDGYCVVVVTHDMDVAERADIVYKMTDGVVTTNEKRDRRI